MPAYGFLTAATPDCNGPRPRRGDPPNYLGRPSTTYERQLDDLSRIGFNAV
jgi:hypothetical protein